MLDESNTSSKVCAGTCLLLEEERGLGWRRTATAPTPKGRPMSEATVRANGRRSKIRAFVEYVFAQQKSGMGLVVRTIGIANLAYNLTHFVRHQGELGPHDRESGRKRRHDAKIGALHQPQRRNAERSPRIRLRHLRPTPCICAELVLYEQSD